MFTITTYKRYENESDKDLLFRIGSKKDIIGSWQDVADILNELTGQCYTESRYRKKYKKILKEHQNEAVDSESQIDELKEQRLLLEKEKIKFRDERNEYLKIIRQEARKESFEEMIKRIICEDTPPIELAYATQDYHSDNDLLCHFTDVHTGIKIDSWFNTFNEDVLIERIQRFISKIIQVKTLHNSENCYLVIGEIISGLIHPNLRLQNNMDLMQQFKYISELISSMLIELGKYFTNTYVYVTPGNHSRVSAKKEEALDGENFDILLPFYLKARLQNADNIHICDNTIDPEIAIFTIRGKTIMSSHGHKDEPNTVVQKFTMLFNVHPDIVLLGHRHTNGLKTVSDTKVIQSGCVSGTDQYASSHRLSNKPEQTISVINEQGLECLYDVQLN